MLPDSLFVIRLIEQSEDQLEIPYASFKINVIRVNGLKVLISLKWRILRAWHLGIRCCVWLVIHI